MRQTLLIPLLVAVFAAASCTEKRAEIAAEPGLELNALGAGLPAPDNSFVLVSAERTVGRFAAALAIARVQPTVAELPPDAAVDTHPDAGTPPVDPHTGDNTAPVDSHTSTGAPPANTYAYAFDASPADAAAQRAAAPRVSADNQPPFALVTLRPVEQALWSETLRGVSAVRELTFLSPRAAQPDGPALDNLCATAHRFGANMLLVYAPNRLGPNSARVVGVLYDTATGRPLAALHASQHFEDEHGREVSPNRERGDHRDRDAYYQAQRQFEAHTLACLRALLHRDSPPPTTQPHRWHQPLIERWWLPDRD